MLPLATIRKIVETDLDDTALGIVAASEYEDLIARYGDDTERVIFIDGWHQDVVVQAGPIESITEIAEISRSAGIVTITILDDTDYILLHGGRVIRRIGSGLNPSWRWLGQVRITYLPVPRPNLRNRVHCDLIKLALQYNGSREEWFGDYRVKFSASYHTSREQIMRQMAPNRGMIFA